MSNEMRPNKRTTQVLKTAVCVAAIAIAAACTSTRTTEANRGHAGSFDRDNGRTCRCGSMTRSDDKLMPLDYDTGPYYDRCVRRSWSDEKMMPLDYDSGTVNAQCCEMGKDGVCPCHSESSAK